jgi:hypothetical protein
VKILSAESDNPAMKVEMSETKPGKEYELKVTPTDLTQPCGATLLIRTNYPANNPEMRFAFGRVVGETRRSSR